MSTPRPREISKEMRQSYDFKFKLIVLRVAGKKKNCAAERKFDVIANYVRRQRQDNNRK